ncbi:MAG: type I methionyl aminopeptidase, partial [Synergistales bacterium]|nr:type I methionyl aminopeptidase [Synergistales bacterium]
MIIIKSQREIELMRQAGKITAAARTLAREMIAPGVSTEELDREIHQFILKSGAEPSFLGYGGFPASACISVNDEVIHGIPGPRVIREGDIVSLDVGATIYGFTGDCAGTFPCGEISEEARKLIKVTRQSFFEGIKYAKQGYRVSDIGHAVQEYVENNGFSVVRAYVGHGVGANLHEEPEVPNFGPPGHGPVAGRETTRLTSNHKEGEPCLKNRSFPCPCCSWPFHSWPALEIHPRTRKSSTWTMPMIPASRTAALSIHTQRYKKPSTWPTKTTPWSISEKATSPTVSRKASSWN